MYSLKPAQRIAEAHMGHGSAVWDKYEGFKGETEGAVLKGELHLR
jgi:hypothetical protein